MLTRPLAIIASTIAIVVTLGARQQSPDAPTVTAKDTLVYIGSYTSRAGLPAAKGKGIYLFKLQSAGTEVFQNVTLVPLGLAAETTNPTFFEIDLTNRRLFVVNEVEQFEGKPTGSVSAYSIEAGGKLTLLNQRGSMGTRPCHLAIDKDGRNVLIANCGSGAVAVFPVGADGRLSESSHVVEVAKDVTPCITFDPSSRFAFVCNPSSDKVLSYSFDAQQGRLTPSPYTSISLKAGAAPRQMLFRQDGRFAYVLNGKQSTVTTLSYDAATGSLNGVQTVSTLPEYFDGANVAGELHIHRSGKWLYASNIGHNSVVLFTIDAEKGTLTFVEEQGTGGKNPRQFGIEPSSKHLAISNGDSDTVLAARIDDGNGRLKPSGIFADVPSPAAIRFLPPLGQ